MQDETYIVETPICSWCGLSDQLEVPARGFEAWTSGMLIQDAFPHMSNPKREQLKTGYHPKCWTEMFGVMEPE